MKRQTDRSDNFRNEAGAYFEKDRNSMEGYYHFCDGRQRNAIPNIWKHDANAWLEIEMGAVTKRIWIAYCPICGKNLD